MKNYKYEIIVVGSGHAGIEAALCCSRMGIPTILLTMDIEKIGQMSCNPAIGGLGKSHLVKDLDALGGEMGKAIDATGIQFRMLNKTKGPAVWSLRVQADPAEYKEYMQNRLFEEDNLTIKEAEAESLIIEGSIAKGVKTVFGEELYAKAVILCNGTFLGGKIFIGLDRYSAGRAWEPPSNLLANNLRHLGITDKRLKTGTPARLWGPSIDFNRFEIQEGDREIEFFSPDTPQRIFNQICCYIGYTNERVHKIILDNLHNSPMYGPRIIEGTGPRYCPSIEDKVIRFADKTRHQIFFEPVKKDFMEVYPNGISTSLPLKTQIDLYRAVDGLENVEFIKPAYAIEYDYADPINLKQTLESKKCANLYLAGQINGTSGYEEAAVQGFIAGCNASLKILGKDSFSLSRNESYIAVLISDLVLKGVSEPYRMFTSRAEHRLMLRLDNAEDRLLRYGRGFGLVSDKRYQRFKDSEEQKYRLADLLKKIKPSGYDGASLYNILKRPEFKISDLMKYIPGYDIYPKSVRNSVEINIKYEGYIKRENARIENSRYYKDIKIPEGIEFTTIDTLTREAQEKLSFSKPGTLYEASLIPGITPANIDALHIFIKKFCKGI